jgi:hypothetical protein
MGVTALSSSPIQLEERRMTVQPDTGTSPAGATGNDQARGADAASPEVSNVASTAAEGVRDVAGEVATQAKAVARQSKHQLDSLVSQTRGEVREQAEHRSAQAADQLRTLSQQVGALVDGRPENAGPLLGYLQDAQSQVGRLASRLEQRGPQGVIDDVTRFARRRPGVFLAGAMAAGFLVGRVVRAGAASQVDPIRAGDTGTRP